MTTQTAQAALWEGERPRLTALAYRILGSWQDAEDVVAQSWGRLADQTGLDRPEAWLTTVVTRLSIDSARRSKTRRESYIGPWLPEPVATDRLQADVAETRSLLGLGLLRLMETLGPEERAIFVLREAFDVPYAEIGECVGRSSAACRQVVSRARAALRQREPGPGAVSSGDTPRDTDRQLLTALVNAVTEGEVGDVVRLVSEDCVLWADGGGVVSAARRPVVGRERVGAFLLGVRRFLSGGGEVVEVNGTVGMRFTTPAGTYLYVVEHDGERITGIQVQANPAKLAAT